MALPEWRELTCQSYTWMWVLFGVYESKLDIFSNRSNNNNPLQWHVDLLKNSLRIWSAQAFLHFTTSNSLTTSIPKYMPQNYLWPLLKEYIGLSSSKVVREGKSHGSCFPHKPFAGSSWSCAPLKSFPRFGETQLRSWGESQDKCQASGEYQYQGVC